MAVVRIATEQDLPHILKLYRQLALNPTETEGHRNHSLDDYQRVLSEISVVPGYELLIADEDGKIIGTTVLVILPGLSHGASPFAVVEYVVVDENHRRQGIGKLLMDYAVARAKEAGCYKIMLTSDKRREQAHEFYRSLGFEASAHGFRLYF